MKQNLLLIGDICTDIYQYGTIDRISPEAPVPVFKFSHQESKPGMAGNVKLNLEAFGFKVNIIQGETSTKTRLIDLHSRQHIVRIDNDVHNAGPIPFEVVAEYLHDIDAVVISDYLKGMISYEMVSDLRYHFKGPIFIDTKKHDLAKFEGCIVKVNANEYASAKTLPTKIIVTLGAEGAMYKENDQEDFYPGHPSEVVDVCGAGDTFLSALIYKYLETYNISESIEFANRASSIAVQHSGVYTLTLEDINSIKIDNL